MLTACAFQPVFGRVFMLFNIKWSYIFSMFMFLLGSLICGIAPSSVALITGRAIAGFGSAGLLTGSFVVISIAVPMRLRPIYTAVVGLMFGVGATVGPLIGGVFTDLVVCSGPFKLSSTLLLTLCVDLAMVFLVEPPSRCRHSGRDVLRPSTAAE
jgi:MFS family permease